MVLSQLSTSVYCFSWGEKYIMKAIFVAVYSFVDLTFWEKQFGIQRDKREIKASKLWLLLTNKKKKQEKKISRAKYTM